MLESVVIPGPPPVLETEVTTSVAESSRRGIALAEPDWNPDDEESFLRTLPPPMDQDGFIRKMLRVE